jgi:beta-lactamase regulating signal transducer with metallopeptidase domain
MNEWQIVAEITKTIFLMSLTGSVLTLILFALKPILKNRIPKTAQYILWLVVLVALLVPFSRILSLSSPAPVARLHEAINENIKPNSQWWDDISQERYQTSFEVLDAPAKVDVMYKSGSAMRWELNKSLFGYPVLYPPLVFAMITLQYAVFTIKLRRRRMAALPEDVAMLAALCDSRKTPRLYRNPLASTPMLIGLFRPAILLPDRVYTQEQLRFILLHELTHLRRGDMIIRWISVAACAIHCFNPLVWLLRREIDRAQELACDEAVIAGLDTSGKQSYGETLLAVAAERKSPLATLAMSEEKRDLKERLHAIAKSKRATRTVVIASAFLLFAAIGVAVLLGASSKKEEEMPFSIPNIVVSYGEGNTLPPLDLGYEWEGNGEAVIADSIAPWEAEFTDATTAYLSPGEKFTVSGDAFNTIDWAFYDMNGECSESAGVEPADGTGTMKSMGIASPIEKGEYVCVLSFRIDERGFHNIEYAFKIVQDQIVETSDNPPALQTAENTLWAGLNALILHLYETDPGLNGDIKYIALDVSEIPADTREPLVSALRPWANAQGCELLLGTQEDLVREGYITVTPIEGSDSQGYYEFTEGILFSFSGFSLDGEILAAAASKWRGSLGAVGGTYHAVFEDGTWTVETPEEMWMS